MEKDKEQEENEVQTAEHGAYQQVCEKKLEYPCLWEG